MKLSTSAQKELLSNARKADEPLRHVPMKGKEIQIPARDREIRILLYQPQTQEKRLPVFFNFHGGGFVTGSPEMDDLLCKKLSESLNIVVVNVDYRLAPEFPFPAGVKDAYDAVRYVHANSEKFGIDPERMAVGGHSAGGNLSTVVCLMAKKSGEFTLKGQVLDYPPLNLHISAFQKDCPPGAIPPEIASMFDACYCEPEQTSDIYVSPALAAKEDLTGLPPALVITAGMDSLRAEGEGYAQSLKNAGVPVIYRCFEDVYHGFTIEAFSPLAQAEEQGPEKAKHEQIRKAADEALSMIQDFLTKNLI